jgi:hypothetical protein
MDTFNQLLDAGLSGAMNELGAKAGLDPMRWAMDFNMDPDLVGLHPEGEAHAGALQLCEQWAKYLKLSESMPRSEHIDGYRRWSGGCGDWEVSVSCITDVALYNKAYPDDQR